MARPYIFEFDFGNVLRMMITSAATGQPFDLTNKTVMLYLRRGDEVTEKNCSVYDAENGIVHYYVEQGDFVPGATYMLQLKVTGSGIRFSTTTKTLIVNELTYKLRMSNRSGNSYLKTG